MDTPEDATKDSPSTRTNVRPHASGTSAGFVLVDTRALGSRRRRAPLAQREEEQEVDEEIPKFLGDEGMKRAAA